MLFERQRRVEHSKINFYIALSRHAKAHARRSISQPVSPVFCHTLLSIVLSSLPKKLAENQQPAAPGITLSWPAGHEWWHVLLKGSGGNAAPPKTQTVPFITLHVSQSSTATARGSRGTREEKIKAAPRAKRHLPSSCVGPGLVREFPLP